MFFKEGKQTTQLLIKYQTLMKSTERGRPKMKGLHYLHPFTLLILQIGEFFEECLIAPLRIVVAHTNLKAMNLAC